MRISGIYFYDLRGKILIGHDYRGDAPASAAEEFFPLWLRSVEENQTSMPILSSESGMNYLYILHHNIYVVALAQNIADAANTYLFLQKIVEVFTGYFKKLEEESIKDNFVIIYELLSEMMDFGYPQTTEQCLLQEYITQSSYSLETKQRLPPAVTSDVPWRSEGIRYRKNEVFLDVIECLNVLINSNGNILKNEIVGVIKMKSHLSGMPDVQMGLNDRVPFDANIQSNKEGDEPADIGDVKFHQCVRLDSIESGRAIKLVPPDGEFEVMKYRLNTQIRSQARKCLNISNIKVFIPVPPDADTPAFDTSVGTVAYVPEISSAVWRINSMTESREYTMIASFGLPSVRAGAARAGISLVVLSIHKLAISGLQVRYLKVADRLGYQAHPWVRYVTKSGGKVSAVFHDFDRYRSN